MIANAKIMWARFAGAVVFAIFVACIFTFLAPFFKVHPAPFELTAAVEFLCGFFVAVAIGMLFNEDSRFNGLIYAIVFPLATYFYMTTPGANIDLLIMMFSSGFIGGIIIAILCALWNNYDKLAYFAKIMLTIFYSVIMGWFLLYENPFVIMDNTGDASQGIFTCVVGCILATILWGILLKVTIGVRASDIFVFGPPNSGKTFFAVGLMNYIMQNENGRTDSYPLNLEDEDLTLPYLDAKIREGGLPGRTHTGKMVMHKLEVQKFGIFPPIRWTVVDYAGEYYNQLNYENYTKAIEYLSEQLPSDVMECVGTEDFVIKISREHADKLKDPSFTKSAIIAGTYGNFLKAGKVIFIVDGEKVNQMENNEDVDTTSLLSDLQIYNSIVTEIVTLQDKGRLSKLLKNKLLKKYAIVVTKTDLVLRNNGDIRWNVGLNAANELYNIPEKSKGSRIIEEAIYEKLNERGGLAFTNLIRWIGNEIPLHFIAVSADATADDRPRGITMPWGYSKIFKFGK